MTGEEGLDLAVREKIPLHSNRRHGFADRPAAPTAGIAERSAVDNAIFARIAIRNGRRCTGDKLRPEVIGCRRGNRLGLVIRFDAYRIALERDRQKFEAVLPVHRVVHDQAPVVGDAEIDELAVLGVSEQDMARIRGIRAEKPK